MMAPDTKAGRLTDLIMARVRGKLPELPTHEYNRVFQVPRPKGTGIVRNKTMHSNQELSFQYSRSAEACSRERGNGGTSTPLERRRLLEATSATKQSPGFSQHCNPEFTDTVTQNQTLSTRKAAINGGVSTHSFDECVLAELQCHVLGETHEIPEASDRRSNAKLTQDARR